MDEAEKHSILRDLGAGRDALAQAVAGVDEALARRKPSPETWSILDCVEHTIETERYLLSRLRAAQSVEQPFEKSRREGKIAMLAADRTRKIEAPEPVHPRGRYETLAEALAAFDQVRAEVVDWVENCAGDPRRMLTEHPLIAGPVTCAETLAMMAAHPARHAKQIEEVRNLFGGFSAGDRIRVADDFFWAGGATGTIANPPKEITAISGPWENNLTRQEESALGTNIVYWIWFDEPQMDADGEGPYRGGTIWASKLVRLPVVVH